MVQEYISDNNIIKQACHFTILLDKGTRLLYDPILIIKGLFNDHHRWGYKYAGVSCGTLIYVS